MILAKGGLSGALVGHQPLQLLEEALDEDRLGRGANVTLLTDHDETAVVRRHHRAILVAAFLMTLPTVVAAQASVGFRGDLSLASFGAEDAEDLDATPGLNIGGFVNLPLSDVVGLQIGAGRVQKGAKETEGGVKLEIGLDYLEIPLLLTLSPPMTDNVGFNFFIGPAVALKTGCSFGGSEMA